MADERAPPSTPVAATPLVRAHEPSTVADLRLLHDPMWRRSAVHAHLQEGLRARGLESRSRRRRAAFAAGCFALVLVSKHVPGWLALPLLSVVAAVALGLGVVMVASGLRALRRQRVDEVPGFVRAQLDRAITRYGPDWDALTEAKQRVVLERELEALVDPRRLDVGGRVP